ncbi:hypothetical protein NEUTE1DRAFT_116844 [Neurospora tetrasperma FGSC 2508]|uniref:Uncharacterized protein n=1 Tax=Neurospora tetrasperma (strain FGSC 2508 / ATCC MYA-4615 / P0657) TaxID=510951 RepID=F8ML53_NEUT8|nr:uncharacterized protein NEUTE1DRAFT_116844 [Neurospora tetrasperma FGSC 2508]EGO57528.1 hypothetical protein NEUTE1DRAFT_116844 [Neurospora tetrasperma FGSC 2508]
MRLTDQLKFIARLSGLSQRSERDDLHVYAPTNARIAIGDYTIEKDIIEMNIGM